MTSERNGPIHAGKPPKSIGEIRNLLTSIHEAIDPQSPGPYVKSLPVVELAAIRSASHMYRRHRADAELQKRGPDFYRSLLLKRSGAVGGLCGGFLGANLGFSLPLVLGSAAAIPLATFLGLLIGCAVGTFAAQLTVTRRRLDLFGNGKNMDGRNMDGKNMAAVVEPA